MPIGLDWLNILPSVKEFLSGGNPYSVGQVFEPFWTYIILSPLAFLPFWVGRVILFLVSLIVFAYSAIRLGATRWQLIFFILSSAVVGCLNNGNLDWLVTAGLWMPPQIGLFFVMMKPQVGIGLLIFWSWQTWKNDKFPGLIKLLGPISLAYLISFWLYGLWPLRMLSLPDADINMSTFPYGIWAGLALLYISMKDNDKNLAAISSVFFAPYISQFSYSVVLLSSFKNKIVFALIWVGLWIPVLMRVFSR